MAKNLNQSIESFNQEALRLELTAALIIEHQIKAITNDLIDKNSSAETKQLQQKILIAVQESIKGMLHADSKEIFLLQQQRFNQLMTNLKAKLALEGDLEKPLEDFRFFHYLHGLLLEVTTNEVKSLQDLPAWFVEHPYFEQWRKQLDSLKNETDPKQFEAQRTLLIEDLLIRESYQDLANLASVTLIEQNAQLLADTRLSYLKETDRRKKLLTDVLWMGLGTLLVVGAAVLSIAFPPLIIPGLVLGAAVLGYGAIDFAKQSAGLYEEFHAKSLGERQVSPATMEEVEQLESILNDPAKSDFVGRQQLDKKYWSTEEKWVKGAGYVASLTGFALAIAAFALIVPGVGVPIAAVIAVAALSLAVAAFAGGLLGFKIFREQQHQQKMQSQIEEKMTNDEEMVAQIAKVYSDRVASVNIPGLVEQHEQDIHAQTLNKTAAIKREQQVKEPEESVDKKGKVKKIENIPVEMLDLNAAPTLFANKMEKTNSLDWKKRLQQEEHSDDEEDEGIRTTEEGEDDEGQTPDNR
ncbi:hypothetical protein [Legionella cardiaca]|uniref:IncA protein n=1 Tax=Legionella cardiaca TaxID=1071983 RepID=A0ABY8AN72_9GAMM|nr:hypothetical protein [Legionella cardiaca]WED42110.1 hypothetical protein PXX05_09225 [Legionella cardiaca]